MVEYILAVFAAVLLFSILIVSPLKFGAKILVKVVSVSLIIVVLSSFIHMFYPLYMTLAVFVLLLFSFSFFISKQQEFSYEIGSSAEKIETNEETVQIDQFRPTLPTKVEISGQAFGRLDQDSIDALLKAATEDKVGEKDATNITNVNREEVLFEIDDDLKEKEQTIDLLENNPEYQMNDSEMELTTEIEEAIDKFLSDGTERSDKHLTSSNNIREKEKKPKEAVEKQDINKSELFDLGVSKQDHELDDIFDGSTRNLSIEDDTDLETVEQDEDLIIKDSDLINEIAELTEIKVDEDVEIKRQIPKPAKHSKANSYQPEQTKEAILSKRSKLFEELEKDF